MRPQHSISAKSLEHYIGDVLKETLSTRQDLGSFIDFLATFGTVAVFGGFVRDAIHNCLNRQEIVYRDLDLVVAGTLNTAKQAKNHFGGYRRFFDDGLKVDYWQLNETYAFKKRLFEPTLANLPCTTVYSINACAFDLTHNQLYEHHAIASVKQRVIKFNCKQYLDLFPLYQVFRAINFADRLGYSLDPEVEAFIKSSLIHCPLVDFVDAVVQHRPDISILDIESMYSRFTSDVKIRV